ncbi:hypothetical protein CJF42_04960 [Pseudoalteromonas sp. NBT06-2]|uniref:hypothetical protein n=1 Tax=Pseudoalteromonas sp. NBT06-2 TaxID=2025950 RepID=UPI000BA5B657|nr:hypothetical protein [Pseudoalteromonas sp. NBT06-2]PAJ75489.1 hypothetical protein CJF42_04960 [Pseudoalteromonas sp. NBT06-2]
MKSLTKVVLFFSFAITSVFPQDHIWVITQKLDKDFTLSKQQVRQIYLGINIDFTDEVTSSAITLSRKNQVRSQFNAQVIGLTESRIQSYWAHMRFSSRNKPPKEYDSVSSLLEHIKTTKGSIGYVPAQTVLPESIVVIYPEN